MIAAFMAAEEDDLDDEAEAELVIQAINEVREESKRYAVIANLQWPESKDFHLFVCGPFNTEKQAEAVGERFAYDQETQRGQGRWRVAPILAPVAASAKEAWAHARPPRQTPCCSLHHGMIRNELGLWTWIKADENTEHWKGKGGW